MNKLAIFILVCMLALLSPACDRDDDTKPLLTPRHIELTELGAKVIEQNNHFGIDLFTRIAREEQSNMMISPLSAGAALTMLLNGCDGETYMQLRELLGYSPELDIREINASFQSLVGQLLAADPGVGLSLANAVFYRRQFEVKPPFLQIMETDFDAHVEGLDFSLPAAVDVINGWAADNTENRVTQVIEQIDPMTVMFLMNALYFKGDWTHPFDKADTEEMAFFLDDGTIKHVPFMNGKVGARLYSTQGYQVAELSYGRQNFSMVLVVPDNDLAGFYPSLTPERWLELTAALDAQEEVTETMVSMPAFSFSFETQMKDPLYEMGMQDAFDPYLADLSAISDEDIFVSFVQQNTFVDVNEQGTEAAAVTTVAIGRTSLPPQFNVDRPFIFAIRERTTNALLFIGSLMDPTG